MALKDSAEEARKNFEKLQKLATSLRKDLSGLNLGDTVRDAETVKELLNGWSKEFQDSLASVDSIGASFQQTVSEISKGNVGLNQTKKSFNKLTSLAQDLTNHTRGYNKLSVKQLESITSQAEQERKRLETTLDTLKAEKDYLTQQGASQSKLEITLSINLLFPLLIPLYIPIFEVRFVQLYRIAMLDIYPDRILLSEEGPFLLPYIYLL